MKTDSEVKWFVEWFLVFYMPAVFHRKVTFLVLTFYLPFCVEYNLFLAHSNHFSHLKKNMKFFFPYF